MSDLLQDIDEALKREKAEKFWRENSPYILGGAVALVIMTGAITAWQSWRNNVNEERTAAIVTALDAKENNAALLIDAGKTLKGPHKAIAELQAAGLLVKDGKNDEALKQYQAVAADSSASALWRDLATLMSVRLEWTPEVDEAKANTLYSQIKPLLSRNNPWHLHAALQAALIAGDSLKDYKAALSHLGEITNDETAPPALKERAKALNHVYAQRAGEKKAAAETETPVPESKG